MPVKTTVIILSPSSQVRNKFAYMIEGETQDIIMPHLSNNHSIEKRPVYPVLSLRLDLLSS